MIEYLEEIRRLLDKLEDEMWVDKTSTKPCYTSGETTSTNIETAFTNKGTTTDRRNYK